MSQQGIRVKASELTVDQVKAWERAIETDQPIAWDNGKWLVVRRGYVSTGQAMEPVFDLVMADDLN